MSRPGTPRPGLPHSLSGRLVLTAVGLVAVVGLLVTVLGTVIMRDYLTDRLDDQVRASLARTAHLAGEGRAAPYALAGVASLPVGQPLEGRGGGGRGGDRDGDDRPGDGVFGDTVGTISAVLPETGRGTSDAAAGTGGVLRDADGRLAFWDAMEPGMLTELASVDLARDPRTVELSSGHYRLAAQEVSVGDAQVLVVGGLPTDALDSAVRSLLLVLLLLTGVGVLAAALAGRVLVRRTLEPLRRVATTAHEVSELPLDTGSVGRTARVPASLTDPETEVGQVGEALNRLLGHVEGALEARHRSEQQVRQFVADASHELRTPLATIMGYAELVRRSPEEADAHAALAKVEEQGVRMRSLVEDLLLLARLDAGRPLAQEEVDLTLLALEAVADAQVIGRDHRWELALPEEPVGVVGDEQRLHQVLTNLLANARRHTPPGTTVRVGLEVADGQVRLSVADDGPGIDEDFLPTVFERFTRADPSRARGDGGPGGAGLGLALVRAIVAAHGGEMTLESGPGRTVFTVVLPAGAA